MDGPCRAQGGVTIHYALPATDGQDRPVVRVWDQQGVLCAQWPVEPGSASVAWQVNGGLSGGVYIIELAGETFRERIKIVLLE